MLLYKASESFNNFLFFSWHKLGRHPNERVSQSSQPLCRNSKKKNIGIFTQSKLGYNLRGNLLNSNTLLLTIGKTGTENNLAFADISRYLIFASGKPVMQITGFAVYNMVAIVQLVRTPGCGPGGRGFKSHWSPGQIANCEFLISKLKIENSQLFCPYRLEA
jgi:hypothetical protein